MKKMSLGVRVSGVYMLITGAWIILSTLAAHRWMGEGGAVVWVELGKGILFVLITGAFLRAHLNRESARQEKLLSEQQRLQSIIGRSPCVAYVAENAEGWPVRYVSASVRRYGYGVEEFPERVGRFASVIHPEDLERVAGEVERNIREGKTEFQQEYRIRTKTGEARWVEDHTLVLRDAAGNATELQGIAVDITERKKAQGELEQSRRLLQERLNELEQIYQYSPVGLFVVDRNHRYLRINELMAANCGMTVEEMSRCTTQDVVPGAASQLMECHRQVMEEGKPILGVEISSELRKLPGEVRHWICNYFPLYDAERRVKGVVGAISDVTLQRRGEMERKRNAETMALQSAALEAAANAIVITNAGGKIQWVNRAFTSVTGYSPEEAAGQYPRILNSGRQTPDFYRSLWNTILSGKVWHGNLTNRRKDGTLYEEDMTISPVRADSGEITHFIAIKQDVTEQRQMEKQFLQAQRMESIGLLAGGVAHDLNNVLAPIMAAIQLLKSDEISANERAKLTDMLETSCRRGAGIIQQVLTFARGLKGDPVATSLRPLINDMARIARETFPRNITIKTQTPKDLWLVSCDPTQIHQIILNLAVNARDAMPDGGELCLSVENCELTTPVQNMGCKIMPGPYVRLHVSDTGSGIAPEIVDRIFDPFFTTKEPGKGTGLGLAALLGIVRNHSGMVNLKSELGIGTTFEVYLPAVKHGLEVTAAEPDEPPKGKGECILVVDDEPAILQVIQRILDRNGYEVLIATDGAAALKLLAEYDNRVDLVLTDVMMPRLDGVALVQAIRAMTSGQKVVAFSGLLEESGKPGTAEKLRSLGVNRIMAKPCAAKELLEMVNEELRRKN